MFLFFAKLLATFGNLVLPILLILLISSNHQSQAEASGRTLPVPAARPDAGAARAGGRDRDAEDEDLQRALDVALPFAENEGCRFLADIFANLQRNIDHRSTICCEKCICKFLMSLS